MAFKSEEHRLLSDIKDLMSQALGGAGQTLGQRTQRKSAPNKPAITATRLALTDKKIQTTTGFIETLGTKASQAGSDLHRLSRAATGSGTGFETLTGRIGGIVGTLAATSRNLESFSFDSRLIALQSAIDSAAKSIDGVVDIDPSRSMAGLKDLTSALNASVTTANGSFTNISTNGNELSEAIAKYTRDVNASITALQNPGTIDITELTTAVSGVAMALTGGSGAAGLAKRIERVSVLFGGLAKAINKVRSDIRAERNSDADKEPPPIEPPKIPGGFWSGIGGELKKQIGWLFTSSVAEALDDSLQKLAARGYRTGAAFTDLYMDSTKAGMGLREYLQVIDESMTTFSRMQNFEEFDAALGRGRDNLAKLGVFGQESTRLTAAMMQSTSSLGIPMDQLGSSIDSQAKLFDELRKTVGLTAEGFQTLVEQVTESEEVQKELLGLAPADRRARRDQIAKTLSWGKSLGLTEQASTKLAQALLEQRKTTVKERFESAGRLTQAMGLAGMGGRDVEEARRLSMKRNRTPEEDQRFVRLMGDYAQKAEAAKQSGNTGLAYAFESLEEKFTPSMRAAYDASIGVKNAEQSGQQLQKETNNKLSAIETIAGNILAFMEGGFQNFIGKTLLAVGGVVANAVGNTALAVLQGTIIGTMVSAAINRTSMGLGDMWTRGKGMLGKAVVPIGRSTAAMAGGVAGTAIGLGTMAYGLSNAEETAKAEDRDVRDVQKKVIAEGLGSTIGGVAGGALGAFFGGPLGLVLGSTIGGVLGTMVGGWFGKDSDLVKAQKESAKALKENTKTIDDTNRSTAGSSVLDITDLGTSAANRNIQATASAYSGASNVDAAKVEIKKQTTADFDAKVQQYLDNMDSTVISSIGLAAAKERAIVAVSAEQKQSNERFLAEAKKKDEVGLAARNPTSQAKQVMPQPATAIATPSAPPVNSVKSDTVNRKDGEEQAAAQKPSKVSSAKEEAPVDAASILLKILEVLNASQGIEVKQAELAERLLAVIARPRFPNQSLMVSQTVNGS